jgi:hypothetical protein
VLAENIEPVARACRLGTWGHLWKRAQENARRADALKTKGDELAGLFQRLRDELGEHNLTFEDFVAYERQSRGGAAFHYEPDYVLPERYRRG